jgi:glycosyltransferase involved in cell wall biosynthesis
MYGKNKPSAQDYVSRNLEYFWELQPGIEDHTTYLQVLRSKWVSPRNYMIVAKTIDIMKPHLVYIFDLDRMAPLSVLTAVEKRKLPVMIHLMSDWLISVRIQNIKSTIFPMKLIKNQLMKRIDRFLFSIPLFMASNTLRNDYFNSGFPKDRMQVLYPAIPVQNTGLNPSREPGNNFRLLYIGQQNQWQEMHDCIQTLIRLHRFNDSVSFTLDMVVEGDAQYAGFLHQLAATNLVASYIKFLGNLDREELLKRMTDYDALIIPGWRKEPSAFLVQQAMYAGLPVVTSDQGDFTEIIQDGKTGLLFRADNPQDLAEKISILQKETELRKTIRLNGHQYAKNTFNYDHYITRIEKVLQKILLAG